MLQSCVNVLHCIRTLLNVYIAVYIAVCISTTLPLPAVPLRQPKDVTCVVDGVAHLGRRTLNCRADHRAKKGHWRPPSENNKHCSDLAEQMGDSRSNNTNIVTVTLLPAGHNRHVPPAVPRLLQVVRFAVGLRYRCQAANYERVLC